MKFILLLFFIVSINCFGQKKTYLETDSTESWWRGGKWIDVGTTGPYKPQYDTVKILMLVCDTTTFLHMPLQKSYYDFDTNVYHDSIGHWDYHLNTWWQFGYRLRNRDWEKLLRVDYPDKHAFDYLNEYFDENKKPLRKSIIVWITKEINDADNR